MYIYCKIYTGNLNQKNKNMEQKYCQSCGMPLTESNLLGTNKDQTLNNDFCIYCFKDGALLRI